ncbi:sigma-54 interaction domain-containing protein [Bacillus horti]|uniref:PAS domain S-box-containing protein n=1 Tax=Caldalkalibacillus horti TaxID=77523 RepID=A0ABT9VY76_9BACI|nr:sigma 54-interacting transcriptional regulator [Bacillus horti]MDQ0165931.1 PAS domain S-box-containing protein [Bacillus horti]
MSRPILLLITQDDRTFTAFHKQITNFYGDRISIIHKRDKYNMEDVKLILFSSKELMAGGNYPSDKVIVGRRAINLNSIEQLVVLPKKTECLIVNNAKESTYDTIEYLNNLGLDLTYHSYYPGKKDYKKTAVAITPQAIDNVPKDIENVINIGIRPLDISTLVELGTLLGIDMQDTHFYSAKYIKEIIDLSRELFDSLSHVNLLNQELDAILNTVHDGIIATDDRKNIIKMNNAANRILGLSMKEEDIIGAKINKLFPKLDLQFSDNEPYHENKLVNVHDKKLVVNKMTIMKEDTKIGDVTAFQDVTRILHLEQDIRKQIQRKGFSSRYTISDIFGNSPKIKDTIRVMEKIGKTDRSVLILGENGTGKELFAHSIHHLSNRKNGPFVPVNFAGLPESLAESELFGYEEGTFTGATKGGKQGLFELAHNGTIFLDEIGDASLNLQILLLRVLQEMQVMRVGGRRIIPVNVRVIAATNRDLKQLVQEGKFREDLYYRLFVLPLRIPPLRERKEDIPLLIHSFIKDYSAVIPSIDDDVMQLLLDYHWPGNIRELLSVIQYMTIVMDGDRITVSDLPEQFKETRTSTTPISSDLIEKLKLEGELSDYYQILKCLFEAKQQSKTIGRGKIVAYAAKNHVHLSEQQVRKRMEVLKDLDLIYSGNKGKGSKITDSGIELLHNLENSGEVST